MPRIEETRPVTLDLTQPKYAGVLAIMQGRAFLEELNHAPPEIVEEQMCREHPPLGPIGVMDVDWTRRMITSRESIYYLIRLGGGVVGGVFFAADPERHREENFWRIFVEPMYHNRGIGQEAFRQIYRRHPDVKRWTVGTPAFNAKTRHFYERMGFTLMGIEDRPGVWFRECRYENILSHEERLKL